jgi:hypothetical protein
MERYFLISESEPNKFQTTGGKTLREAIDSAISLTPYTK